LANKLLIDLFAVVVTFFVPAVYITLPIHYQNRYIDIILKNIGIHFIYLTNYYDPLFRIKPLLKDFNSDLKCILYSFDNKNYNSYVNKVDSPEFTPTLS